MRFAQQRKVLRWAVTKVLAGITPTPGKAAVEMLEERQLLSVAAMPGGDAEGQGNLVVEQAAYAGLDDALTTSTVTITAPCAIGLGEVLSASAAGSGAGLSYAWTVKRWTGAGEAWSTVQSASGANLSYTPLASGTYELTVVGTDQAGGQASSSRIVAVKESLWYVRLFPMWPTATVETYVRADIDEGDADRDVYYGWTIIQTDESGSSVLGVDQGFGTMFMPHSAGVYQIVLHAYNGSGYCGVMDAAEVTVPGGFELPSVPEGANLPEGTELPGGMESSGGGELPSETISGTAGNDAITIAVAGNDSILGEDGNDVIYGASDANNAITAFNDTIDGGAGNDTVYGSGGNDRLNWSSGNDSLAGGGGDDTYVFYPSAVSAVVWLDEAASTGSDALDFRYVPTGTVSAPGTMVYAPKNANGTLASDIGMALYPNVTINGASGTAARIERVVKRDQCGVLLTGSEAPADAAALQQWNAQEYVSTNNCYAYAVNDRRVRTEKPQPGEISGQQFAEVTVSAVKQAALNDGLMYMQASGLPGLRFLGDDEASTLDVQQDEYVVFLVVTNPEHLDQSTAPWELHIADYHWYRHNPDGTWSHKPGGTPATLVDDSGSSITSPKTADRRSSSLSWIPEWQRWVTFVLDYALHGGYFAVRASGMLVGSPEEGMIGMDTAIAEQDEIIAASGGSGCAAFTSSPVSTAMSSHAAVAEVLLHVSSDLLA